jgi:dipeptidyl-peptidase-4
LEANELDQDHPYFPYLDNHIRPEFGVIEAEDGQAMHYRLYKPADFDASKKYPVIIDVYGGPLAQRVTKSWGVRNGFWHQYMAQRGYAIFSLDNRGSGNRGTAFEFPLYHEFGDIELRDQLAGVDFLKQLGWVDAKRIGIFGWSYGGYMTLIALMKAPGVFAAGVSVAPVTDWRLYDTHYTERYLGAPAENEKGYHESNVFPYVDGLSGDLLIVHGMADDNVLFTHSTKLFQDLQEKQIPFEMMNYPGHKHSISGTNVRIHLYEAMDAFFDRTLGANAR